MMPRSVCRCGATRHDRRDPPRVPLSSGESRGTTGGKEGPGGAERMAQPRRGVGVSGACACRRTSESGRGGEVLEVVTFVRWCGPVEPFPDDGRFDEARGGGGPVTYGQRETCEPFERSCCHGRFAEPATQFQRLLVPAFGCSGVPVGLVAPPQTNQCDPFPHRGSEVDEPVYSDGVVPSGEVPVPVDVGQEAVSVSGEYLPGAVPDLTRRGCCFIEQPPCGVALTHVHLPDREIGQGPLSGVPQPGTPRDVNGFLQDAGSLVVPAELP